MNSVTSTRIWTIALPLACLVIGGVVFAIQMTRLKAVDNDLAQTDKNIAFVEGMIKVLKETPVGDKEPAILQSPDEQATFLNELRLLASNAQVDLTRWQNTVPNQGATQDPNQQRQQDANKSLGVITIASSVEASGPYQNLRTFLYSIWRSPRLLNISNVNWGRGGDNSAATRLQFTLTRYVVQPSASPTPNNAAPAATTNTISSGGNQG